MGYHFHYTITGDRALSPLVLLHGWMGNCDDYAEVIGLLKSQYYCIAIDLPGHGKTEVIGDDRGYEFTATAIGIIQLLDGLKIDRCTIAGYSFGGRLALYLALEFPDRFDRAILESISPGLPTRLEQQARITSDAEMIHQLTNHDFADFVANWYRQAIFTGLDQHPSFLDLINYRIITNRPINLAKSLQFAGLGQQPYLGDRLKIYKQPILLMIGALDLKFVSIAKIFQDNCPQISIKTVPNCSHNIHFQQPQIWVNSITKLSDI
jgi:2-succinyl-6-hydroxy-2,4-cyclohexadiene-1-carboxylate synthase